MAQQQWYAGTIPRNSQCSHDCCYAVLAGSLNQAKAIVYSKYRRYLGIGREVPVFGLSIKVTTEAIAQALLREEGKLRPMRQFPRAAG